MGWSVQVAGRSIAALAVAILLWTSVAGQAENTVDKNLQIMLQAARSLKFIGSERAYILTKRSSVASETVMSEVAVIFGYGDNRLACRDIAEALTPKHPEVRAMHPGRNYECYPVY